MSTCPVFNFGMGTSLSRTKAFEGSPLRTIRQARCLAGTNPGLGASAMVVEAMFRGKKRGELAGRTVSPCDPLHLYLQWAANVTSVCWEGGCRDLSSADNDRRVAERIVNSLSFVAPCGSENTGTVCGYSSKICGACITRCPWAEVSAWQSVSSVRSSLRNRQAPVSPESCGVGQWGSTGGSTFPGCASD